jgi:cobalt-zinc-cadmium efflux system outer membrane protein
MKWCRYLPGLVLLASLGGCGSFLPNPTNGMEAKFRELAAPRALDASIETVVAKRPAPTPGGSKSATMEGMDVPNLEANPIQPASAAEAEDKEIQPKKRKVILTIPSELPGSDHQGFKLPKEKAALEKYIGSLYPPLPPLPEDLAIAPCPDGRPLTLTDLQRLANTYSPAIRAAEAAVVAARGALRQSMAYPNPTFAFMNDTLATGPAGYPGFSIDQVIKTGNKLQLQGAAAAMDLFNAQLALRKARNDVAYQVRNGYFGVLVALENVRLSRAFARFTDQIYTVQVNLLKGNEAAAYEPMQLRPLALQARFNLIQAGNQYRASWRQLAAHLGLPDMPPSELAGRVDLPVPKYDFQLVQSRMLTRHTDVLTAENNIHKAEYLVKLAEITPIPDVDVSVLVQRDYTTPPFYTAPSVHVSVPLPVWDQNRGAIQQAKGLLSQAVQTLPVARNTLITMLADAFNRYLTAKKQVDISRDQLKDQVRVYKHVYDRFRGGGDLQVTFGDLVTAQQTLAGYLNGYIAALGFQWTAVVDVANLLQTDDLFQGSPSVAGPDAPSLEHLESLLRCPSPSSDGAAPIRARLGVPQ